MDFILQLWGGSFYLTNKICFALAESKTDAPKKRQLKLMGWAIYILGVPAWVIILTLKHNWIAASIEAGGLPAMIFGLFNVIRRAETPDKTLDRITSLFTYGSIVLGVGYSLHDYGGIVSVSQVLEICVTIGFLLGSYLLAKNNIYGWLFFMLMNGSMGTLMLIQDKPILAFQQGLSFCFVIYGFMAAKNQIKRNRQMEPSRFAK